MKILCSKCGGATDTGFNCVKCGHSMQPQTGGTQSTDTQQAKGKICHEYGDTELGLLANGWSPYGDNGSI